MTNVTSSYVLVMEFLDAVGKKRTIRLVHPKENLTAQEVQSAMDLIVDLKAFQPLPGVGPAQVKGAKTVQTTTEQFDITVE